MTQYWYSTIIKIPLSKAGDEPDKLNMPLNKLGVKLKIGYRKDSKGGHFIHSENLEPKTEDEKFLLLEIAKKYGFDIYDEEKKIGIDYFKLTFKDDANLDEFQEKVDKMFKAIEDFQEQRKSQLVSVRIPGWLKSELENKYDNNTADIIREALDLWRERQKELVKK